QSAVVADLGGCAAGDCRIARADVPDALRTRRLERFAARRSGGNRVVEGARRIRTPGDGIASPRGRGQALRLLCVRQVKETKRWPPFQGLAPASYPNSDRSSRNAVHAD